MVLPEVWEIKMLNQIFKIHPEKFTWFNRFGYLHSQDILEPIIMKFRFVIENFDIEKFDNGKVTSTTPDPEQEYPEAFDNYPVTDTEVTRSLFDDVTARTFWISDFKEMEKSRAHWMSPVIKILLDDPKLKLIVMKHLHYEMAKNVNEFERLKWWNDFMNKHTQSKRERVNSGR